MRGIMRVLPPAALWLELGQAMVRWVEVQKCPIVLALPQGHVSFPLGHLMLVGQLEWDLGVDAVVFGNLRLNGPGGSGPGFMGHGVLDVRT